MNCENCNEEHLGNYGSGRFCSSKCARGFSTKFNREETSKKVALTLKGRKPSKESIEKMFQTIKNKGWILKNEKVPNKNSKYVFSECLFNCKFCNVLITIKYKRICEDCKGGERMYKEQCAFKFNVYNYPNLFDLSLLEKFGWYSPFNSKEPNLNGISSDHIISVSYGFKNKIDPKIISHPLNCALIRHSENNKKNTKCGISLTELLEKINNFEKF